MTERKVTLWGVVGRRSDGSEWLCDTVSKSKATATEHRNVMRSRWGEGAPKFFLRSITATIQLKVVK